MNYTIQNHHLRVTVSTLGAELQSVRSIASDEEFLWHGDSNVWSGRAPVLFPIVGALKDSQMHLDGQVYSLPRHGLARRKNFKCVSESSNKLVFQLDSDSETLAVFPWHFTLEITYTLSDNHVHTRYTVTHQKQTPDSTMLFTIGSHPAFYLPLKETPLDQFSIRFNSKENLTHYPLNADGLLALKGEPYPLLEQRVNLDKNLFNADALVFKNINSSTISLWQRDRERIRVNTGGAPHLGLWAKPGAPFICIEPWHGYSDATDASGNFEDKPALKSLSAGESFHTEWFIQVVSHNFTN